MAGQVSGEPPKELVLGKGDRLEQDSLQGLEWQLGCSSFQPEGTAMSKSTLRLAVIQDGSVAGDGVVPLRPQVAKESGNTYFALLSRKANGERYFSRFGVAVKAQSASLPTTAVITLPEGDLTVELAEGKSMKGHPQRKYAGAQDVPGLGRKFVEVKVSNTNDGVWNVNAVIRGVSTGGTKVTAESALDISAL